MKYCQHCGGQLVDEAVVCIHCGRSVQNISKPVPAAEDKPSAGLNTLAFFFPIVGLIMYLVWMNSCPNKAKGVGKWALIGFIVSFVLSIIFTVLSVIGSAMAFGNLAGNYRYYW